MKRMALSLVLLVCMVAMARIAMLPAREKMEVRCASGSACIAVAHAPTNLTRVISFTAKHEEDGSENGKPSAGFIKFDAITATLIYDTAGAPRLSGSGKGVVRLYTLRAPHGQVGAVNLCSSSNPDLVYDTVAIN